MMRTRAWLGLAAGGLLILSAAAHSLLGWPELSHELAKLAASADLTRALAIGWHFGGVAMVALGAVVVDGFAGALRRRAVDWRAVRVVGLTYFAFGAGALVATGGRLFFLIFLLPGLVILAAAPRGGRGGLSSARGGAA
jgi:hypothetical protein